MGNSSVNGDFYGNQMNWLVVEPTPLKNMFVSWDDDIPNWMEKNVPNHQPAVVVDKYGPSCDVNIWTVVKL